MPPSAEDNNTTSASPELKEKFIRILQKNGISDEVKDVLIYEPAELKGEHIATATAYVKITFKNDNLKSKNLFVKKFSDNELHTQNVKEERIMEKESAFFNEFLPSANTFCKEQLGVENMLDFFPKCLYGDDELIVLENLVLDSNYVMLSSNERQDELTAKIVISNLAKFHAVSYAMVQKWGTEEFKKKLELCVLEPFETGNTATKDLFENGMNTCINIIKFQVNREPFPESENALKALESYIGQVGPQIKRCCKGDPNSKLLVLNHGDCWNNNMMFQKDPATGTVTKHIFVDLQGTRLTSPNVDLAYFLFTSINHDLRQDKLKELLKFYYSEFDKTSKLFGYTFPITFEEFLLDFKNHCTYGFIVAVNLLAAVGALKGVNLTEDFGNDMNETLKMLDSIICSWIEKNPDKGKSIALDIARTVKEYEDIQTNW